MEKVHYNPTPVTPLVVLLCHKELWWKKKEKVLNQTSIANGRKRARKQKIREKKVAEKIPSCHIQNYARQLSVILL